jgi:hypothetical protein
MMHQTHATADDGTLDDDDVNGKLDKLESFIARRFDEISMEIEATSQLMEMAEEDAAKRFRDMLGMLNAISFAGDGSSPANSGAELEAVVKETEDAATKIMDAADNIGRTLENYDADISNDMRLAVMAESIHMDVQAILLACGFQDLVSQRVTTSLKNIRDIEEKMSNILSKFGIDTVVIQDPVSQGSDNIENTSLASQDDINALFD